MDRAWIREAAKLEFLDPTLILIELRRIEGQLAGSTTPTPIRNLRTNRLKAYRELREAALFCHGMTQHIGQKIYFARSEAQDYDFIASWITGDARHYAPVQMKEVVPRHLNREASLSAIINSVDKYKNSHVLTVAIHLNQQLKHFKADTVRVPRLSIAGLWVFGSISPDQSQWGLWGDFLQPPLVCTQFGYPV